MTIDENIGDEKLHYGINRTAVKLQSLSSRNIHKYEDIRGG